MERNKKIICTVTNDLNYDQRMIRICTSLTEAGYDVTLVGLNRKKSGPLINRSFKQVRLGIVVEQGKLMYLQYWISLFFFLLWRKADIICAIDLDTIVPVYYASVFRRRKRVYDAHEIFTELKEVIARPSVHKMWKWIGNYFVPKFPIGYTIGAAYAQDFKQRYGVDYKIVRNATILRPLVIPEKKDRFILYQGAVNVGRCFEQLIPAMKFLDVPLVICGEGNFYEQAMALSKEHRVEDKVTFKGYVPPADLKLITEQAWVGITLFEDTSISNRLSLANRFFDYMHNGVPQICNMFAEYVSVNEKYEIACLLDHPTPESIAAAINSLKDTVKYNRLQSNCIRAREEFCWQQEAKTLVEVYKQFK